MSDDGFVDFEYFEDEDQDPEQERQKKQENDQYRAQSEDVWNYAKQSEQSTFIEVEEHEIGANAEEVLFVAPVTPEIKVLAPEMRPAQEAVVMSSDTVNLSPSLATQKLFHADKSSNMDSTGGMQLSQVPTMLACSILGVAMFAGGFTLLIIMRKLSRKTGKSGPMAVSGVLFFVPLLSLLVLKFFVLDNLLVQICMISMISGIILSVYVVPRLSGYSIKLSITDQVTRQEEVIWLSDVNITVGAAKKLIKEVFKAPPRHKLNIEGGRGNFIDSSKNDSPLIPLLASTSVDLTGILSLKCRVVIEEPEVAVVEMKKSPTRRSSIIDGMTSVANSAMGLLISKNDIRFEEDSFMLLAKFHAGSSQRQYSVGSSKDSAGTYYATAYPETEKTNLTAFKWKSTGHAETVVSEESSPAHAPINICPRSGGTVIRDRDEVVLKCNGRFMFVNTFSWLVPWSSEIPRKSGVFIIDIIEKAKQNMISEQFNAITGKISKVTSGVIPNIGLKDQLLTDSSVLAPGDTFRLRNKKRPDYELGVTLDKINKDKDCLYLGLRKVSQKDASSEWCRKSMFSIKI